MESHDHKNLSRETLVKSNRVETEHSFDSDKKVNMSNVPVVQLTTPDPPGGTYRLYRRRFVGLVALVSCRQH